MSEKLKPCPFCGGKAVMYTRATLNSHWRAIQCESCSVATNYHSDYHACDESNSRCAEVEQNEPKMNEWKRYPDEKPKEWVKVLVCNNGNTGIYTFFERMNGDYIFDGDVDDIEPQNSEIPLYWLPLPEPPKEEK